MTTEPEQPTGTEEAEEAPVQTEPTTRQERRDEHVRSRLHEVEAERDRLRERLDARDRAEVDARAREALGGAVDLFSFELDDLRNDDGDLDPERIEEALEPWRNALEQARTVHHGDMGPRKTTADKRGPTWGEVFQRR